jgi:integrase-like protein
LALVKWWCQRPALCGGITSSCGRATTQGGDGHHGRFRHKRFADLVVCSSAGAPLQAGTVRRAFRRVTKKAGIGETWTPRELRHSLVSIISDRGVPLESIADLCGPQLKPVIPRGAEVINSLFEAQKSA